MQGQIFAFTLITKEDLFDHGSVFDTDGYPVGRILKKYEPYRTEDYMYDIESSKETLEKLEKNEIKLYGINDYRVMSCSVWYTRK